MTCLECLRVIVDPLDIGFDVKIPIWTDIGQHAAPPDHIALLPLRFNALARVQLVCKRA